MCNQLPLFWCWAFQQSVLFGESPLILPPLSLAILSLQQENLFFSWVALSHWTRVLSSGITMFVFLEDSQIQVKKPFLYNVIPHTKWNTFQNLPLVQGSAIPTCWPLGRGSILISNSFVLMQEFLWKAVILWKDICSTTFILPLYFVFSLKFAWKAEFLSVSQLAWLLPTRLLYCPLSWNVRGLHVLKLSCLTVISHVHRVAANTTTTSGHVSLWPPHNSSHQLL